MKKFLAGLACVLVLAGCSAAGGVDAASFNKDMKATAADAVRVYVTTEESRASAAFDAKSVDTTTIQALLEGLTLTESEDQSKIYGDPFYFVELNKVVDANFARFIVYGDGSVVVVKGEEYKNYTISEADLATVSSTFEALIPAAE